MKCVKYQVEDNIRIEIEDIFLPYQWVDIGVQVWMQVWMNFGSNIDARN